MTSFCARCPLFIENKVAQVNHGTTSMEIVMQCERMNMAYMSGQYESSAEEEIGRARTNLLASFEDYVHERIGNGWKGCMFYAERMMEQWNNG